MIYISLITRINKINIIRSERHVNWLQKLFKQSDVVLTVVNNLDENKDGKITVGEIVQQVSSVLADTLKKTPVGQKISKWGIASEYIVLFIVLSLSIVGFFIPDLSVDKFELESWIPVISIILMMTNIIYGGVLKANFQNQLASEQLKARSLQETIDANKNALDIATQKLAQSDYEKKFWKDNYDQLREQLKKE